MQTISKKRHVGQLSMTFNLTFNSLLKTISLEAVNIMNSFDVKTVELKVKTLVHVVYIFSIAHSHSEIHQSTYGK